MTAKRKPSSNAAPASLLVPEKLATLVHYLRHEKVILDSDLAELYGVEARVLNQAVKRNIRRFPSDFMFQLNEKEAGLARSSRSQTVTLKNPEDTGAPANSSQIVMSSRKHRGRAYLPYAFTEQGVAMLSSVLRSERAVEVNIAIMRTFVQLRRLMDSNALLAEGISILAFQHFRISAFTFGTRLPHDPIRSFSEKITQAPENLIADRRSWIDDVTKRQLLIFPSTIHYPLSLPSTLPLPDLRIDSGAPPAPSALRATSAA